MPSREEKEVSEVDFAEVEDSSKGRVPLMIVYLIAFHDIVRIVCVMMSAERIRAQISSVIHFLRVLGFGDRMGGLCLCQKRLEACENSHCSHGTASVLADVARRQRGTR